MDITIPKDININFNQFNVILDHFRNQKYKFINPTLSNNIKNAIQILFPNLNKQDFDVLSLFTENIIEKISNYNYFKKEDDYYKQWEQNNYQDIKGVVMILLPFIDDKNNGKLLNELIDLNQYLYTHLKSSIPSELSLENRTKILKTDFKFSNMSLGLLSDSSNNNLLELFEKDGKMKLIYKIIHHNYLGLTRTLQVMNGKYYQNWINIVPILYNNSEEKHPTLSFKESQLYKKTEEGLNRLENKNEHDANKKILNNPDEYYNFIKNDYYGLYLGDIYNTIKIKMYDEIKHIKWLIFIIDEKYIIQYLGDHVNIDNFFKYSNYDDIDIEDEIKFTNFINNTCTLLQTNNSIFDLWKQILLFLTNNYSKKLVVSNEFNIIQSNVFEKFSLTPSDFNNIDNDNNGEDYTNLILEIIYNITPSNVIKYLSQINIKHVWNFLQETIKLFENTYLRDYFIEYDKETKEKKIKKFNEKYYYPNTKLSFKNIYNIAKSITHYTDNKGIWVSHEDHSISFTISQELIFFKKFLNYDVINTWLNLRKNLKKELKIFKDVDYIKKINEIKDDWDKIKLDIVFEILTKNGILSEFNIVLDITDKSTYKSSKEQMYKKMKDRIGKNEHWKEAYYYLTNNQYKNLEKIRWDNPKTNIKEDFFYFELFSKDQLWYSFYAMDWLSQINFFHHYIHHRVLYVTGATGQGKSTQVPKLLMYALKAYEMKNNGKVVCTQPRISPTTSNSERISDELGVSIFRSLKKGMGKEKTNNFYVQMKYSDDAHIKNNCPHLTLKILTDGTIYEELQTNPLMKEQIFKIGKKDFTYGYKNHYDIIILDESHEHNTNMDMVLTLTRQSCLYNNSLRLIIMSATMDEDEPIYRSYFRCINDDLLYPIKAPLYKHPILDLSDYNIYVPDTIYMDRRFHISPPGQTTQYIVSEIYNENVSIKHLTKKKAAELTQEESYKTILEICQKYPTGDILLFSIGAVEINKAVETLNQILPQGNIALPFYSGLHIFYKDIVEKIETKIHTIKNKRERIYLEWGENFIEDPSVPSYSYKRAIIVATNVAEASITINSLKFIVDTGYAKVNEFNSESRLTQLNIEEIAEASRVQRKGRIGRVSDGIAYFVYSKGSRERIKPKYKITQEDQTNMYLKLLKSNKINETSTETEEHIINPLCNPNNYNSIFYNIKLNDKNHLKQLNTYFKQNILNILCKQYSIKNNIINKELFWNKQYYTESIIENICLMRAHSGQLFESISDYNGQFYIIHPKENKIIRNINNEIKFFLDISFNSIPPNIFSSEIEILKQKLILIDTQYSSNIFNIKHEKQNFVKTELYSKVLDLHRILNDNSLNDNDCLTIFAAIGFNCLYEVLSILMLIKTINTISTLIISNKAKLFYNIWYLNSNSKSEIFILNNIIKKLKSDNINLYIYKIIENPKIVDEIDKLVQEKIDKFKKKKKLNLKDEIKTDDIDNWNLMNKLFNSSKLENKNGKDELKFYFLKEKIKKDLDLNELKIKIWCEKYFINYEHIKTFLFKLGEIIISFLTIDKNLDSDFGEKSPLEWIKKINLSKFLKTNNINEKIMKSFILGRPLNYGIKLDFNNDFYNLYSSNLKGYTENNFFAPQFFSNIIFYYDYSNIKGKNYFNFVNDIDLDYYTSCSPHIFNKNNFKKIIPQLEYVYKENNIKEHKSFIQINGSNYDQIIYFLNNNSIGQCPWENEDMPVISNYLKKLRI